MENLKCAIFTAKVNERLAFQKFMLDTGPRTLTDGGVYITGKIKTHPIDGISSPKWEVAVLQTEVGQSEAAAEVTSLLSEYRPHIALFIGVAGGLDPSSQKIGHIVVGERVQYYERGANKRTYLVKTDKNFSPARGLIRQAAFFAEENAWPRWLAPNLPNDAFAEIGLILSGEKVQKSTTIKCGKLLHRNSLVLDVSKWRVMDSIWPPGTA